MSLDHFFLLHSLGISPGITGEMTLSEKFSIVAPLHLLTLAPDAYSVAMYFRIRRSVEEQERMEVDDKTFVVLYFLLEIPAVCCSGRERGLRSSARRNLRRRRGG